MVYSQSIRNDKDGWLDIPERPSQAAFFVTKVNGVVKQDGNTRNLIWDEAHMIRYLTSILTLYPGDVISSGTPDGVGAGRKPPEFLKNGDVVAIEIEGIGTLTTPMRAAAAGTQ